MNKELKKVLNRRLATVYITIAFIYSILISIIEKKFSILPLVSGIIFTILCMILFNILLKFIQKR